MGLRLVPRKTIFKSLEDSINVYDAYNEILPDRLQKLTKELSNYDFEVDIYGQKESFSKEYVLTSKPCNESIKQYARAMKPQELNIIYNISGDELKFTRTKDVKFSEKYITDLIFKTMPIEEYMNIYRYYFTTVPDTKILFKILRSRFKNKILRSLGKKSNH
jgi:hypothetical protein